MVISGSVFVTALITLIVAGLIFWLLWWLLGYVGLPQPFLKVGQVLLAVAAVLFLINLVLSLTGNPVIRW